MRTRSTTLLATSGPKGPFTVAPYTKSNGAWVPSGTGVSSVPQGTAYTPYDFGESVITDDPAPSDKTKTVTHRRRIVSRHPINSYLENTSTDMYACTGPNSHYYSWGLYGAFDHTNIPIQYGLPIEALRSQAMHRFFDTNQVDSLLNIIESPQLLGSLRQLASIARQVRSGGKSDSILKIGAGITGKKARNISSLYLAWQFGFAPLISDMKKVMLAVQTIKSDLNRAASNAGKPYVITAREVGRILDPTGMPASFSPNHAPNNSTWWHHRYDIIKPPVRLVGCKGVRTIPYHSDAFRKLDYLMGRFLSPGPVSLIWERIPFSFVVDWFVDLSGILDSLNNALTGDTKRIKDLWWSESWALNVCAIKHPTSVWASDADGKVTCTTFLSYYHREALQASIMPVWSGRFGKKQALLSVALLHQIVASLKR